MSGDPTSHFPYAQIDDQTDADLSSILSNLQLQTSIQDPNPITCLAHLKLIHAFGKLKESIGYTNGLFGIWDSRAHCSRFRASPGHLTETAAEFGAVISDNARSHALSKLREKRWAIYVARAVDRYEAWWSSMFQPSLKASQLSETLSPAYETFPITSGVLDWNNMVLPPLDVLMVLHTHMLNPRFFLEDCMRYGAREFWAAGMPWEHINAAIDNNFNYIQSGENQSVWSVVCYRNWDNTEDMMHKLIECPSCRASNSIPWTTCGMDEVPVDTIRPGLVGTGCADGAFSFDCTACGIHVNPDVLCVDRLLGDCAYLLEDDTAMRGTILDLSTGCPKASSETDDEPDPRPLANDALKSGLGKHLLQLSGSSSSLLTIETIRALIDDDKAQKKDTLERKGLFYPEERALKKLYKQSSIGCQVMLYTYQSNSSRFSLDLQGAVLRQGIFIDDMVKLDWIHQPSNTNMMARFVTKYNQFFDIIKENEKSLAVPTLDVDLAWHTHLLSPFAYYRYSTELTEKLIDHADKIDDVRLCKWFEWTNMEYEDRYGEVYTECTCWYCDSLRTLLIPSLEKLYRKMGFPNIHCEVDEKLHEGIIKGCPHISAHNSVKIQTPDERDWRWKNYERARDFRERRLRKGYDKLCRRARKKGRQVPPRKMTREHWGYYDDGCVPYRSTCMTAELYPDHSNPSSIETTEVWVAFSDLGQSLMADETWSGFSDSGGGDGGGDGGGGGD